MEKQQVFGIPVSRGTGLAAIGYTAEILKIVKTYEGGRADILTFGRNPFRLPELF